MLDLSTHKHCGTSEEATRLGAGCRQWLKDNTTQKYSGNILNNNLHNKGVYIIEKSGDQAYYDGYFFCNKLEGYAKVIYPNTIFEGLFKQHVRFGPGVFTNADNTQDVGIWDGNTLRRLLVSVDEDCVPRLGRTSLGRARLLKFRKLVSLSVEETQDEETICNRRVRHPESLFFPKSSYSKSFAASDDGSLPDCCCFQKNSIDHLSVQLYEVEVKLQKLQGRKSQIERQLSICKDCCAKVVQICDVKFSELSKSGSFPSSEIELNTFIYTIPEESLEESSQSTQPFEITNPKFLETVVETEGFQACICNDMLVDNIDTLQAELLVLQQEKLFYTTVKTAVKNHLDSEFRRQQETTEWNEVTTTDFLAWNNEAVWIEVLQHCFRHRSLENNVSFDVQNLLRRRRDSFSTPGAHETDCLKFLEECAHGNERNVLSCLKEGINPDICDARGNTGLMLASANDQSYVITTLANCGAKLDVVNDEGLTPLTMTLLRYISIKFNIVDWEAAFLKDEEQSYTAPEWLPADSLLNVISETETKPQVSPQEYFFSTNFPGLRRQEKKNQTEDPEKLKNTKRTVSTLLNYGCDSNFGIPLKPIFLALFTDDADLLHVLLKNNADPNAMIDTMTPLHIIAAIKPSPDTVKMCELLLIFHADPNVKTDQWPELKKGLLGGYNDDTNGQNPLHLICLRQDFPNDSDNLFGVLAQLLVLHGCRNRDLYLGHTPLSLAVLRGNTRLVESLLKTKHVDPHQVLGNNMGNALTVLVLNRFRGVLPKDRVPVAETLMDCGLNPLVRIEEFENVVAFMENETKIKEMKKTRKGHSKKSEKKSRKSESRKSKKKSRKGGLKKSSKKKKVDLNTYILARSKEVLLRHLKAKAVEYSYILIAEGFVDPFTEVWAKFTTAKEAFRLLELLFQEAILEFDLEALRNYLVFLRIDESDIEKIQHQISDHNEEVYTTPPEIDRDDTKYRICFQCLKGQGKNLTKCPSCELVYFCSEKCKKKSKKSHPCSVAGQKAQTPRLEALLKIASKMKHERAKIKTIRPVVTEFSSIFHKESTISVDGDLEPVATVFFQPEFDGDQFIPRKSKRRRSSLMSKQMEAGAFSLPEKLVTVAQVQAKSNKMVPDSRYYMELLSKIFADFNLPLLLLPYACYKDGQVYYKLSGSKPYSDAEFYQLTIPK